MNKPILARAAKPHTADYILKQHICIVANTGCSGIVTHRKDNGGTYCSTTTAVEPKVVGNRVGIRLDASKIQLVGARFANLVSISFFDTI